MKPPPKPPTELVPAGHNLPSSFPSQLPQILIRAGKAAVFATEEFFFGRIRNEHTRSAYMIAVKRFLAWAEARGLELRGILRTDLVHPLNAVSPNEKVTSAPVNGNPNGGADCDHFSQLLD